MRKEIGKPADAIWLTGGVAFAGQAEEYDFAYRRLEETLCPAAGCRIEDVFVIPGNHDVDRRAESGPASSTLFASFSPYACSNRLSVPTTRRKRSRRKMQRRIVNRRSGKNKDRDFGVFTFRTSC